MPAVPLGEIVEIKGGGTPSKANASFWNGDIPWVSPKDMKSWDIRDAEDKITLEAVKGSATNLIPENATLVVNRSGILKHTLPVGITRRPVAINQDLKALIAGPRAHPEYIAHMVKAAEPIVLRWVRATTADNFPIDNLRALEVPLPPLDDQRRIAAILDKADALRRKRRSALALLRGLTRSIFLEMFGHPVSNPRSLPVRALSEVATFTSGGTPSKEREEYWGGDIPWVSPKDMKVTDIFDSEDHVSESALAQTSLKSIEPMSVLIVVRGMILAHTAPLAIARRSVTINQDMKAILFRSEIDPEFGYWCLKTQDSYILSKVSSAAHGTKRLETSDVGSLNVLIPTVGQQKKFVDAARATNDEIDHLVSSLRGSENLFSSLQSRAFSGQL